MDRELLLLGVLRGQEMHGYQVAEFIARDMAYCTDLKKPTAYYLLKRLSDQGLIREHSEREGNRPERRVYSLTEAGEREFQRLLRENLSRHEPAYFTDDIGLAFIEALPIAEAAAHLAGRRAALQERMEALRAVPPHQGGAQLVIEHRLRHFASELAWIEEVIARLAQASPDQNGNSTQGVD